MSQALDAFGRPLRDLRISVTDRCNFRCTYCMPKEVFGHDYRFLDRKELLDFDEITRVARVAVGLGVRKLRLTGGEPLIRRDVEVLVGMLAELDAEITLTTNASLLPRKAQALADAGLDRITVSLDAMDDATFRSDERRRLPGRPRARRDRGRTPRGTARQGQLRRQARRQRRPDRPDGDLLPRDGRHAALHRVHGRGRHERLADGRRRPRRRDRLHGERCVSGRARRVPVPRRGREAVALRGRQRRGRRHRLGHPAVLRRLHPLADLGRGQALHVPLRGARPRPARAHPERRERRGARRLASPGSGRSAATVTRSCAPRRRTSTTPRASRCRTSAADPAGEPTRVSRARSALYEPCARRCRRPRWLHRRCVPLLRPAADLETRQPDARPWIRLRDHGLGVRLVPARPRAR